MRGNDDRFEVDDGLGQIEAEMKRPRTEREESVAHAEDLGYQVEVLRAKLHDLRRQLATPVSTASAAKPSRCSATPNCRPSRSARTPSAQVAESRAHTQRLMQEAQQRSAQFEADWQAELAARRRRLDEELIRTPGSRPRPAAARTRPVAEQVTRQPTNAPAGGRRPGPAPKPSSGCSPRRPREEPSPPAGQSVRRRAPRAGRRGHRAGPCAQARWP
ncbi:hypothetical protein ACU686_39890 [Yinghuangia aomiensis]